MNAADAGRLNDQIYDIKVELNELNKTFSALDVGLDIIINEFHQINEGLDCVSKAIVASNTLKEKELDLQTKALEFEIKKYQDRLAINNIKGNNMPKREIF